MALIAELLTNTALSQPSLTKLAVYFFTTATPIKNIDGRC